MTTTKPVVRAYARISVFSEVSQQIDQARHLIEKWAGFKHPDREVVWYTDEAISGGRPMRTRPAGGKLLRELRKGDVLAVTKIDRAARNVADLLDTLQRVEAIGASFVATEQDLSTEGPYGRFTVVLLGAVAELERDIMGERQRAAREQLHRDGRHIGRVHYGYEAVPHPGGKGLVVRPHPVEGPKLRAAVEAVLAGRSMASQARALGVSRPGMQKLLRSERLIGRTPGDDSGRIDPDAALITISQWNALRTLVERDEPRSWSHTDGYSLALSCSVCQGRMYLDINSGSAGGYRCKAHKGAPTIARGVVDRFVEDWFVSHYANAPLVELVIESDDSERVERLAGIELAIREAAQAQTKPGADVLALAQHIVELHAERARIEAEPGTETVRQIDTGLRMGEKWEASSDHERVTMLRQTAVFVIHGRGREGGRVEVVDQVQEPERFTELSSKLPSAFVYSLQRQGM